jgi:hypothetical protein
MIRNRNVIKKTCTIKPRRNNTRASARRGSGGIRIEINATPECAATAPGRTRRPPKNSRKPRFSPVFQPIRQLLASRREHRDTYRDAGRSPRAGEAFDIFNARPFAAPATTGHEEKSPGFRRGFRYDRSQ